MALHRAHDARPGLAAQRGDVRVHGARGARLVPVPDLREQLVAGERAAGPGSEREQEAELGVDGFKARGVKVSIGCKQLYHDREEVTCHLRRLDMKRKG